MRLVVKEEREKKVLILVVNDIAFSILEFNWEEDAYFQNAKCTWDFGFVSGIRATKQKNERKSEKFINVKVHRESKPLHRLFFDVSDTV